MTTQIYQKYTLLTKNDMEAQETLYYLSHETTPISEENTNLSPALDYTMTMHKNRVILIVPSTDIGYQAASILSSKLAGYHIEEPDEEDTDEYNLEDYDDIFDDDSDEDDFSDDDFGADYLSEDDALDTSISDFDFRIIKQTPFDRQEQEGEGTVTPIVMKPSNLLPEIPDRNILLFCSSEAQSAPRMEEFLNSLMDKNLILLIKKEDANSDFVENMVFKYGFDILKFKKPSLKQETAIFQKLLHNRGCRVSSSTNLTKIVQSLITYRDYHYEEADLERFANKMPLLKPLKEQDFAFYYYKKQHSGSKNLEELIGQTKIKESIQRTVITQVIDAKIQQERDTDMPITNLNFSFSGEPGTGKTETARILSRILHENGIRNGKFVEAGREDIVGKYLGHTSPAIASLFKRAKGGVIFIDEIDSLISNDSYAHEAVSALVRHMENNQDTTVIFATYPEQMRAFIDLNPGLSSRISKNFVFQSYTNEELWEIFKLFAKKEGFETDSKCKKYVTAFIDDTRKREKKNFGNARVMRKLFQEAKECCANRIYNSSEKNPAYRITTADIKEATHYQTPATEPVRMIGFVGTQNM